MQRKMHCPVAVCKGTSEGNYCHRERVLPSFLFKGKGCQSKVVPVLNVGVPSTGTSRYTKQSTTAYNGKHKGMITPSLNI